MTKPGNDGRPKPAEIAVLIRRKRVAMGYSLEDMSVVTGLTTVEIANAERGVIAESRDLKRLFLASRKLRG